MITLIKIVVILGVIAFPIVKSVFKGVIQFNFNKGFVIGANYLVTPFVAEIDGENRAFELYNLQFHIACLTCTMAFSIERKDVIIEDE